MTASPWAHVSIYVGPWATDDPLSSSGGRRAGVRAVRFRIQGAAGASFALGEWGRSPTPGGLAGRPHRRSYDLAHAWAPAVPRCPRRATVQDAALRSGRSCGRSSSSAARSPPADALRRAERVRGAAGFEVAARRPPDTIHSRAVLLPRSRKRKGGGNASQPCRRMAYQVQRLLVRDLRGRRQRPTALRKARNRPGRCARVASFIEGDISFDSSSFFANARTAGSGVNGQSLPYITFEWSATCSRGPS